MSELSQVLALVVGIPTVYSALLKAGVPVNDWVMWFFSQKKKEDGDSDEGIPSWARKLQQHFNHETTESLTAIKDTQEKTLELMREHNKLDERVITLLENFDKYGMKCRRNEN